MIITISSLNTPLTSGCYIDVSEVPVGAFFEGIVSLSGKTETCLKIDDNLLFIPGRDNPLFHAFGVERYRLLDAEMLMSCKYDHWIKFYKLGVGETFLIAGKPFIKTGGYAAYSFVKRCLVPIKGGLRVNPVDLEIKI